MATKDDYGVHLGIHLKSLESLRGGVPEGLPAQLAEVAPILDSFDSARARITADADLSQTGRENQLNAARAEAEADIEQWRTSRTTGIESQIAASRTANQATVDKELPKPTDLQVTNMIQRLAGFDPLEIEILYADASDTERRIIEVAAESIGRQPVKRGDVISWEPLIPSARVAAVMEARIASANPPCTAALRDLERIRNTYDFLAGSAKALLKES